MAAANDFINTTDITDAGGNLASASGNISTSTTIKGAVGYGRNTTSFDAADFYKLSIGTTGTATLKLTGLSDNLQLVLKNSDGSNLNMSLTAGAADESVSYPVSPGTYYAYVYPDGYNQSAYTLNVSLPTTSGHDTIGDANVTDAGASLATASGSISASSTISIIATKLSWRTRRVTGPGRARIGATSHSCTPALKTRCIEANTSAHTPSHLCVS